jgi:hypothetical protein
VQFDEPWRDDEAAGVNRSMAAQRTVTDRLDAAADDADVRHAVESGLGIHDMAIGDDEVVGGGRARTERQRPQAQYRRPTRDSREPPKVMGSSATPRANTILE